MATAEVPTAIATALEMPKSYANGFLTPTLNSYGFMIGTEDDDTSARFVQHALSCTGKILDVGCAYGNTLLDIVRQRRQSSFGVHQSQIVANDLDGRHLEIMRSRADAEFGADIASQFLELLPGPFPDVCMDPSFLKHSAGSFDCVRVANVFHFFNGEQIERSAHALFALLRPGGKVYITALSPYTTSYLKFVPQYEQGKKEGHPFPGYISDRRGIYDGYPTLLPNEFHGLDPDVLSRVYRAAGFEIEKAEFYSREKFGKDITFDGREAVGLIAVRVAV
eukprot:Opistho-2@27285